MQQSSHPFFTNVFLASNETLFVYAFHICFLQHCSKAHKSLPLFNQIVLNIFGTIWWSPCSQLVSNSLQWPSLHGQFDIFNNVHTFFGPTPSRV
jgi:hypothetical protein